MPKGLQNLRNAPTSPRMSGLLDMSGRRWSLRVVWELRRGALNFRGLREACGGISPGVLQRRLHEWRKAGVVEMIPGLGYRLTARGEHLFRLLAPLTDWAAPAEQGPRRTRYTEH
ncbi:MAG: winged helix-turn-helix transcriptional regulator [Woeseiaceae bacterium]